MPTQSHKPDYQKKSMATGSLKPLEREWVTTAELKEALLISRPYLDRLKRDGIFKAGIHYRKNGVGQTNPLRWKLKEVEKTLCELTIQAEPLNS